MLVAVLTSACEQGQGQGQGTNAPAAVPADESVETAGEKKWEFTISSYAYLVPDSRDFVQPTVNADRGWFHFEARYNYENLDTGSAWLGYNFSGGERFPWEFTPMVGGVYGETDGVAPGYKGSLGWWKLKLYSEGEYVFDHDVYSESFFYNWSELTLALVDWFRFGMVTQRTRIYGEDRDIQRGVLGGFTWRNLDLAGYVINPDETKPTLALSIGLSF
jgi:hypothetical protein